MVCLRFDSIAFALHSSDAKLLIKVKLLSFGLLVMFYVVFFSMNWLNLVTVQIVVLSYSWRYKQKDFITLSPFVSSQTQIIWFFICHKTVSSELLTSCNFMVFFFFAKKKIKCFAGLWICIFRTFWAFSPQIDGTNFQREEGQRNCCQEGNSFASVHVLC